MVLWGGVFARARALWIRTFRIFGFFVVLRKLKVVFWELRAVCGKLRLACWP